MTQQRTTIIAGNWKMNYGPQQAASFVQELVPESDKDTELERLSHQYSLSTSYLAPYRALSIGSGRESKNCAGSTKYVLRRAWSIYRRDFPCDG